MHLSLIVAGLWAVASAFFAYDAYKSRGDKRSRSILFALLGVSITVMQLISYSRDGVGLLQQYMPF